MFSIQLLLFHLVALQCSAQLLEVAFTAETSGEFVSTPILFGECDPDMCGDATSPYFGARATEVTLNQLTPCLFKLRDYSEDLGEIQLDPATYCDPRPLRGVPGRTCCFPQLPAADFPRMVLYPVGASAFDTNVTRLDWRNPNDKLKLPSSGRIVILVHGWTETPLTGGSLWIFAAIEAWTRVRGCPVIVVEYTNLDNFQYFQNAANARTMGQSIGKAIVSWGIAERTHIVGFSLGGQIIGEVARYTKRRGHLIDDCVALDPAGPGFDLGSTVIRITPDVCGLVQTIHSSSESIPDSLGPLTFQLGSYYPSGSCDFWINCGRRQAADCQNPTVAAIMDDYPPELARYSALGACSHHRATLIYSASVAGKCDYIANECINCNDFKLTSGCRVNFQGEIMRLPPFNDCKPSDRKDFYVQTVGNNYPYCPY